jgi:cytidine deaminase
MRRWTVDELKQHDPNLNKIIRQARSIAYARAYAPYSGFAVGAAARDKDENIYLGANLENAAYGVVMCAEVGALTAASAAGAFGQLRSIAVVGFGFHPQPNLSQIVTPCGRCRQLIFEAAELSGKVDVFACSGDLKQIEQYDISELLPRAFGPKTLGITNPPNPARAGMKPFDDP